MNRIRRRYSLVVLLSSLAILLAALLSPHAEAGPGITQKVHIGVHWGANGEQVGLNLSADPPLLIEFSLVEDWQGYNDRKPMILTPFADYPSFKYNAGKKEYMALFRDFGADKPFLAVRWKPENCAETAPIEWFLDSESVRIEWRNPRPVPQFTSFNQQEPEKQNSMQRVNPTLDRVPGMFEVFPNSQERFSRCTDAYWWPSNLSLSTP
jgi:hypothetical protein